ncbi:RNA ligase family protein [Saccharothrix longispora]|uniref:RNA ligase family protein n=1 Tax=Saccharothrix longispora TaxID=33920 RepID=UPI0028FD3D66|nr:RNA ligase family protein [Saccharothrix longispora]MDU0292127.1 RNA ligase family protein [Saccharothrix longispora]
MAGLGRVGAVRGPGVPVPPVLWRGVFDGRALRRLRVDPARQEGFVVRTAEGFGLADFGRRVAKWVRPRHVTTDRHWMTAPVVPNGPGPRAVLWDVRSGAPFEVADLPAAVGVEGGPGPAEEAAAGVGRMGGWPGCRPRRGRPGGLPRRRRWRGAVSARCPPPR